MIKFVTYFLYPSRYLKCENFSTYKLKFYVTSISDFYIHHKKSILILHTKIVHCVIRKEINFSNSKTKEILGSVAPHAFPYPAQYLIM